MGKRFFYKRFFKRMKRAGMFKGVIYDEFEEHSYPFISEKNLTIKRTIFVILLMALGYFIFKPPMFLSEIKLAFTDPGIPERIDEFGMSALHRAVIRGNARIVKILIRHGSEIDRTDRYGWSSLHWAYFLGKDELLKILISNGADQDLRSTADWFVFKSGSLPKEVRRER